MSLGIDNIFLLRYNISLYKYTNLFTHSPTAGNLIVSLFTKNTNNVTVTTTRNHVRLLVSAEPHQHLVLSDFKTVAYMIGLKWLQWG